MYISLLRKFLLSVNWLWNLRALSELERSGLVASERTSGRFICNDTEMIRKLKEDVICRKTDMFIEEIRQYGCDDEAIIATVEERLHNGKAD